MIYKQIYEHTCIFVMDAICYAHIPADRIYEGRGGELGGGRVGSVLMSKLNVAH